MGYGNESQKRVYDAGLRNTDYQNNIYKYTNFLKLGSDFYTACMMYAVYNEDAVYVVDPNSIKVYGGTATVFEEFHWTKSGKIRICLCLGQKILQVVIFVDNPKNLFDKGTKLIENCAWIQGFLYWIKEYINKQSQEIKKEVQFIGYKMVLEERTVSWQ